MKREAGFTLIELLCALTILALVLAVSLRIVAGSGAAAASARDYGRALALAQSHLAALQAVTPLAKRAQSGEDAGIIWHDSVTLATEEAFATAASLHLVAWRMVSEARLPDGRQVALRSLKLERAP